ncbi:MAG TPA: hypothetical protein VF713_13005 [Thermoanaerobaculia bacterium]
MAIPALLADSSGIAVAFLVATSGRFFALGSALASMHFAAKDPHAFTVAAAIIVGIPIAICALLYCAVRSAPVGA